MDPEATADETSGQREVRNIDVCADLADRRRYHRAKNDSTATMPGVARPVHLTETEAPRAMPTNTHLHEGETSHVRPGKSET
jgi:hypothetical protein